MDQRGYIITRNTSSTTADQIIVALQDGRDPKHCWWESLQPISWYLKLMPLAVYLPFQINARRVPHIGECGTGDR